MQEAGHIPSVQAPLNEHNALRWDVRRGNQTVLLSVVVASDGRFADKMATGPSPAYLRASQVNKLHAVMRSLP
jgi:hypothetical protein